MTTQFKVNEAARRWLMSRDWDGYMIPCWEWPYAPNELRALSQAGGDEDFVGVIPPALAGAHIPWLEDGSFGVNSIKRYEIEDKRGGVYTVCIGQHA